MKKMFNITEAQFNSIIDESTRAILEDKETQITNPFWTQYDLPWEMVDNNPEQYHGIWYITIDFYDGNENMGGVEIKDRQFNTLEECIEYVTSLTSEDVEDICQEEVTDEGFTAIAIHILCQEEQETVEVATTKPYSVHNDDQQAATNNDDSFGLHDMFGEGKLNRAINEAVNKLMRESYEPEGKGKYNTALRNLDDVRKSLPNDATKEIQTLLSKLFDAMESENMKSSLPTYFVRIEEISQDEDDETIRSMEGKTFEIHDLHRTTPDEEASLGVEGCDLSGFVRVGNLILPIPFNSDIVNSNEPYSYQWAKTCHIISK